MADTALEDGLKRISENAERNGRLTELARCVRRIRDFALLYPPEDPRRQALQQAARGLIETSADYRVPDVADPLSGQVA